MLRNCASMSARFAPVLDATLLAMLVIASSNMSKLARLSRLTSAPEGRLDSAMRPASSAARRSEERRVGKEWRSGRAPDDCRKKEDQGLGWGSGGGTRRRRRAEQTR